MTESPRTHSDLIRSLIRAVDGADQEAITALTAWDVQFRFRNAAPTSTQSELLAAAQSFHEAIADLHHTILDLWEVDDTVIALMDVFYRRLDGRELNLPCCNVFRVRDGVVNDYRIYMDVSPVLAP